MGELKAGNGDKGCETPICRFYGRGEEGCEVGASYLSPSDVETVVRYCSADFTTCRRYSMLAEKWSGASSSSPDAFSSRNGRPRGLGARLGSELDREVLQHELRTPLTSILASAEILKKNPDRSIEVRERFVNVIHDEAQRLTRTVEALFEANEAATLPAPVKAQTEPKKIFQNNKLPEIENTRRRSGAMEKKGWNRGWTVVLAGTGINLALGILYAWSIFKGEIAASVKGGGDFNWDMASINDPYALCCLVFAFAMIVAGKCQDKIGPRVTAMIGGLLVGAGFITLSLTTNYWWWLLGFGVLAGTGIGFGYSSATPPAIKWFPPAKTGMIAGIVVSGFGLASVYIAPLSKYLVGTLGLQQTMLVFGVGFAIIVTTLSILLMNPDHAALELVAKNNAAKGGTAPAKVVNEGPKEMLKSYRFYALWVAFFVGSGAGLMVIGSMASMAKASLGEMAFLAVALMAIGNAAGRIVAGMMSDRIGRLNTLMIMLGLQAVLMFASIPLVGDKSTGAVLIVALATAIGFNYGTNLSLFPSLTKDYWGLKNFGLNYGLLFTSWGVGGFAMGRVSQMLEASTGSFTSSFVTAGAMLVVGIIATYSVKLTARRAAKVAEEKELAAKAA